MKEVIKHVTDPKVLSTIASGSPVSAAPSSTSAVSAALGLDTSGYSFGYVASWAAGKTDEEMRACMRAVRDATKGIVDRLQLVMEL